MTEITPEAPKEEPKRNYALIALDVDNIVGTTIAGSDLYLMDEETAKSKEKDLATTSTFLRWVAVEIPEEYLST